MVVILLRLSADTEFLRGLHPKREGGREGGGGGDSPGASRGSKLNPPVLLTSPDGPRRGGKGANPLLWSLAERGVEPHAALERVWT